MKRSFTVGALMALLFLLTRSFFSALLGGAGELVGGIAATLVSLLTLRVSVLVGLPRRVYYRLLSPAGSYFLFTPFFILAILGLSALAGLIGSAVGWKDPAVSYEGPLAWLLLIHALVPAVCEEITFRYCLPSLLAPYGKAGAVLCSSVLFALMHTSPVRIPYALAAGLMLGLVAEASHSPLPGIVMHCLNNACSLLITLYGLPALAAVLAVLGTAAVICLFFLLKRRGGEPFTSLREVCAGRDGMGRMAAQLVTSPMLVPVVFLLWVTARSMFFR